MNREKKPKKSKIKNCSNSSESDCTSSMNASSKAKACGANKKSK